MGAGMGLVGREPGGGAGSGTEGGGAGGPRPTMGMPRSSCGRDETGFSFPRPLALRDGGRHRERGRAEVAVREGGREDAGGSGVKARSGRGVARSHSSSEISGTSRAARGAAKESGCCGDGRVVSAAAEREGFRLRMGGVKTLPLAARSVLEVESRLLRRNGVASAPACMLLGLLGAVLGVGGLFLLAALGSGVGFGSAARSSADRIPGGSGKSDSRPEGVRETAVGRGAAATAAGSTWAVKVWTTGVPLLASTWLKWSRYSWRVGGRLSGVDGFTRNGRLKGV